MEPLRCIYASQLLLDHQLQGVGECSPAVRDILADATLTAFDRVVDEALTRDVDGLLISGDCFDPQDRGLRGPAAFVRGLSRLADRDIAVFVHAATGIWSAWPVGLRWPPHAHRLGAGFEMSGAITRHGRLRATVGVESHGRGRSGWQIHIADPQGDGPVIPVVEDIGPLVGMHAGQTGPRGCSVIEIESGGPAQHTFVPVSPVRWETCTVELHADSTRDDLLQDLLSQLEQTPPYSGEQVRLVTWEVAGHGPLLQRLREREFWQRILAELTEFDPWPGVAMHSRTLRLTETATVDSEPAAADDLAAVFVRQLTKRLHTPQAGKPLCDRVPFQGPPWQGRLQVALAEIETPESEEDARRLSAAWFADEEDLAQ